MNHSTSISPPRAPKTQPSAKRQRSPEGTDPAPEAVAGTTGKIEAGERAADAKSEILLAPAQRLALEQLTSGRSLTEAAAAAGINRTTLYRWLHSDAHFQAACNAWQSDATALARARLLTLTDTAISAVQSALERGDAKAGLSVLKSLGILKAPTPGPTDPKEIQRQRELEETRRFARELQEKFDATMGLETERPQKG